VRVPSRVRGQAEGFCYLNDLAVAARAVRADGGAERIAIVDLDVHQGNGTAVIFQADPDVYTFSMHQEDNYPVKEKSDRDVGLVSYDRGREGSPWVEDGRYLGLLEPALEEVLDASRPDLVLYQAGADPYVNDQLGGFSLSLDGLRRRDEAVYRAGGARVAGATPRRRLCGASARSRSTSSTRAARQVSAGL
jgi:acetoin utilization deacetylase AcuC-like enzyme